MDIEGGHEGREREKKRWKFGWLGKMKWILLNLMFSDDQQNIFYEMKEFRWKEKRKA
jgi:hypothetical protein